MSGTPLAFEGAEGFGADTVGGRGGQVIKVTNLNDSGPGSLRWALEDVSGPRTVVFEVNGTITLKNQIIVDEPNVTIAGQTALGEGITIAGSRIRVKADEVIIRGLKFRPGDGAVGQEAGDRDGLFIGTSDFRIDNVVVDHNSFEWGLDENFSISGWVKDITVSNNIIAQGLSNSIHPKGEHSKGLLISNWGGSAGDWDSNITITKNLFADNTDRNPALHAGQNIEIVNNYIYNFGWKHEAIHLGGGTGGTLVTSASVIGNVIEAGPNTVSLSKPISVNAVAAGSAFYVKDNIAIIKGGSTSVVQDQSTLTIDKGGLKYVTSHPAFTASELTLLKTSDVKAYVLANAGANHNDRDAVDASVVSGAASGTGKNVNSVAEAGGHPDNPFAKPATDTDGDGMPNWFEDMYGLASKVANANGDNDQDGYTNIEEYINGLITGFNLGATITVNAVTAGSGADQIYADQLGQQYLKVTGFSVADGDKVQLGSVLPQFNPATGQLSNYVEVVNVGRDTFISVDTDGAGTADVMRLVAHLQNVDDPVSLSALVGFQSAPVVQAPTQPQPPVVTPPVVTPPVVATPPVVTPPVVVAPPVVETPPVATTPAATTPPAAVTSPAAQTPTPAVKPVAGDDLFMIAKNARSVIASSAVLANDTTSSGALRITSVSNADHGVVTLDANGDVNFTATAGYTGKASFDYVVTNAQGGQDTGHADILVYHGINGTAAADKITVSVSDWVNVAGGDGNDQINSNGGDDLLDGGNGNDLINGGAGADYMLGGAGTDTLNGGAGDDLINGGADADKLSGDAGNDVLLGGAGADTLAGGDGNDSIDGGADLDKISGGAGDDLVYGGDGDDNVMGEAGNDRIFGDAGNDSLSGGEGNDRIEGGAGADRIAGGAGNDVAFGGEGNDTLNGEAGADELHADAGDDKLDGGEGNDKLYGDAGFDTLTGGIGDDWLYGGAVSDRLTGGAGADYFVMDTRETNANYYDTIVDFVRGQDKLVIDGSVYGMSSFTLDNLIIGAGAKATKVGATLLYDTKSFTLSFDADGSGALAAQKLAVFSNKAVLDSHDFTLL